MRKLNQKKIRWIIKQIDKGEQSTYRIAKTQDITPRWARELHHQFHTLYQYPYSKKSGRKPKPVTDTEKQIVLEIRKQHPLAAVTLEKILAEQNIHIGHINNDEELGYATNADIAIASGTQIGSKKHTSRSSSSKTTPHVLSQALAYFPTPIWRTPIKFSIKP
jgi:transposase